MAVAVGDVPSPIDQQWINPLILAHNYELPELRRLLEYYEGRQRLSYMHPELVDTLDERVRQVVINWPRLVVDALEERIDLQGFRLGGQPDDQLVTGQQEHRVGALVQQPGTGRVLRRIRAADGRPGVYAELAEVLVAVFDAHPGDAAPGDPAPSWRAGEAPCRPAPATAGCGSGTRAD
ncbi:hypothetical protein AB0F15_43955 [Amycolatopsis sp. NPDC026612]|uniref:hypothetical protein n=1 Tax=Amycolatopsis sp. NPDC026612 TaxID=3155466 RepID=UPI0033F6C4AA